MGQLLAKLGYLVQEEKEHEQVRLLSRIDQGYFQSLLMGPRLDRVFSGQEIASPRRRGAAVYPELHSGPQKRGPKTVPWLGQSARLRRVP